MNARSCVLIGGGSVLVRCGSALLADGVRIAALVTEDPATRSWAIKTGTAHYTMAEAMASVDLEFDLLLSIGNLSVIPAELLARARSMNLNYHYGPLPEYSGVNAPAWAVAERADTFAVTWHVITELVDGGDVVWRVPVPITAADTALSLGLKCDDAAVASVVDVVRGASAGRLVRTPQDLGRRRYFSRRAQFAAEGLLDWSRSADEVVAQVRATDYGRFGSPLVWPKILVAGQILAVREATVGEASVGEASIGGATVEAVTGRVPGEVLGCDDERGLEIALPAGTVRLTRLCTPEGVDISPARLAHEHGIAAGTVLPGVDDRLAAELAEAGRSASEAAGRWVELLQAAQPFRLPFPPPSSDAAGDTSPVRSTWRAAGSELTPAGLVEAVCTFLNRASGEPRIEIAVSAPRPGLAGNYRELFNSWLPLRVDLDGTRSVSDNRRSVADEFAAAQRRGWLRRDEIGRDEMLAARYAAGQLVPDVLITWGASTDGVRPALELAAQEDGETVEFRYDPARLARADVVGLAAQLADWWERLPGLGERPLADTSAVPADELTALAEFNATEDTTTLGHDFVELFERSVGQHSARVAVVCGADELTYAQLNAEANRLAAALLSRGVNPDDLVGIALDRSTDLVVALLAVLKTGAAYVPIDPGFPAERVRLMIEDANPKLVLTSGVPTAALAAAESIRLSLDDVRASTGGQPANPGLEASPGDQPANPIVEIGPDRLAYVIYTSGSTGRPKGVEVSHGALCNFLLSMRQRPGCAAEDRLLAITTISFDIAALELLLPLLCGARTIIARGHETTDAGALFGLMQRHAVTMMQGTPATWQLLLDAGRRGDITLAKVLCGGEALSRQLADRLLGLGDEVWNMYGPTEATVWSSAWPVRPQAEVVIGRPIANTQLYVLDADLLPVPLGFPGELCIGGSGLAHGYHGQPEATAAQFVDDPLGACRLYRTGDQARFLRSGELSVLGRRDGQVKLRGYRIELGEVETAIAEHPDVARTAVVGRDDQLVAYCVPNPAPADGSGNRGAALAEWTGAWDQAYRSPVSDPMFNIAGWRNSYDGQQFPDHEMRDWQAASARRILAQAPDSVLEIGSGTGLMLHAVAPHCTRYHAVDASEQAVALTRANIDSLPQVTCEHRAAHDLPETQPGTFDTVVINSVAQYFPDLEYLISVIDWATSAIDTGRVFLGDVRDLSLLEIFHADVLDYRTDGRLAPDELAEQAARAARAERELVIAPAFFASLSARFPRISRVDVTLREGSYVNEMTRYRYDVTLHVGGEAADPTPVRELGWLDLATAGREVAALDGHVLRLTDIPNARLSDVRRRVGPALGANQLTADANQLTAGIDPQSLLELAAEAGLEAALLPSRSGDPWCFDAVFWRTGQCPDLSPRPASEPARYANTPAAASPRREPLGRLLRPWLAERLPSYMVPAFFVEVAEFPLTPNGKIDRNALPDPVERIEVTAKPATELEQDILAVWTSVLGHDRFGINDNFFEVGGDSLRVVRVQLELEQRLGRPISSAKLYEHYTIRALAADLAGAAQPSSDVVRAIRRIDTADDIAIIAMACRLPGDASTPEQYWDLLARGGDGIVEVPKDRWDAEALYDPDPEARGMSYCRSGGFVSPIDLFDAPFFGVSPREARALDPMQRMILETSWEAFERAGCTMERLRGSNTGAFIGVGKSSAYHEYGVTAAGGLGDLDGYVGPGSAGGTMSGRVSYVFGLEGPTMTVDTACSSSLVTTHLACTALRQGECDLALSAGVSLMLSPELHVEFSRLRGMSPDGRCRSFSVDTEGTGWSEGCAAVVLKRLSDAQRDGDPILGVLRGTAVNHDGHAASLTTPSGPAQRRVIRAALGAAGLQPGDIDYVEAHGTGTKLGDPIEGAALADVFGGSHPDGEPLWIGSAKSNLGHTQAAAGLAGVLKVVLAMQHETLPRTLHVTEPTPAVDWDGAGLALVREERPWPVKDRPRRAGVSSFGIGGTNAHVIIEEPPRPAVQAIAEPVESAPLPPTVPLVLSGFSDSALREQAENLHRHMGMNIADRLGDIAFSLATTRSHFRRRLVMPVKDKAELLDKLASFARTGEAPAGAVRSGAHPDEPKLAMLFTGQGSQLPGMGKDVYDIYPVFREAVDEIVAHFSDLERPLLEVMWAAPDTEDADLLNRTDFTQPALFTLEVALWRLWQSWGVQAEVLLGHSIGELAAAHVAGVLELPDACRLVAARGRLMQALPVHGAMASLAADGAEVERAIQALALTGRVDIAGLNTPTQTVVSGDTDAVEALTNHFVALDRKARPLTVSHAFHSHHMDGMLAQFRAVAEQVSFHPATIGIVSGLTGEQARPGELQDPDYWVRQVRHTVRFNDGMQTLKRSGANVFLELGPQPTLSGMGATCLADERSVSWLPSLVAGRNGAAVVQNSLAELHVLDLPVDWAGYFAPFGTRRVALPTYAFQRERFWFEPPPSRTIGAGLDDTNHVLLGGGVSIAGTELSVFTNVVTAQEPAWVAEHRILGAVLLPGTAFFEAMRAAGEALGEPSDLADVVIVSPMVLQAATPMRFQVTVGPVSDGGRRVQVYSVAEGADGPWQLHAEGRLVPRSPVVAGSRALPPAGAEPLDVSALYEDLADLGYDYGPTFQGIKQAWHVGTQVWARSSLPEAAEQSAARFGLHPALLDSAMHSLLLTQRLQSVSGDDLFVPFEAAGLSLRRGGLSEIWVHVAEFELGEGEFWATLDIYDSSGENVGRLDRLHARRMDRAVLRRLAASPVDRFQFDVDWRPVSIDEVEVGGSWGLLCPAGEVSWARALKASLGRAGIQVIKVADLEDAEDLDGLLCLWDGEADLVSRAHEFTGVALTQLQAAAESGFQPPLVWLTRQAVSTGTDGDESGLAAAPLWGMMRTARSEHPELKLRSIDLDDSDTDRRALAAAMMLADEPECALREGQVLVPQLRRVEAGSELTLPVDAKWQLEIAAKGRLDEPLKVLPLAARSVGAGEIRAEVKATGVNFLDVLNALGMVEIPAFGLEFAGVVTEVGAGVKELKVGDPVLGLARGSFASEVVVDARLVAVMPATLTFAEAATIPMTFLTAWYGLHVLGDLKAGERLLVHAAAGGVGMAAVQLARLAGADVYGTASEPKWPALRELGLDDDHIASSRDLGFVEKFAATGTGPAFDVVLNSLATEFIDASLGLLGAGGRFLEMGKIDVREQSVIDATHPGVSYTVYNLPEAGPDLTQEMLRSIVRLFADGELVPLPLRTFAMTKTSDALRFMAQARHVGKVVLVPTEQREFVRTDGAVLVTGGTGDLGRRVAGWLASRHGVRDFVLTSRQGPDAPGAEAVVAELAELGASATVLACDSADPDGLAAVLARFDESRPLRGVIHASGVLDDGALTVLTPQRCEAVLRPKVDGAWHLHRLTREQDLDIFMMFSSIASVMGAPGQGNYAAANAFLDALAGIRRAKGLPATSVAWGPWDGAGMAAGLSEIDRVRFAQLGLDRLTADEGLELFDLAVGSGRGLTMAAALDLTRVQRYFEERGGIPPLLRSLLAGVGGGGRSRAGGADLRKLLGEADATEHPAIVLRVVREEVAKTLGFGSAEDVDVTLPLQDIGIDSLTAVLMRNQLADLTSLALPAKIAFDHPNLTALSEFLLAKLVEAGLDDAGAAAPVDGAGSVSEPTAAPAAEVAGGTSPDLAAVRKGCLAPELRFDNAAAVQGRPESVFVTGATGFVGAFLLRELLEAQVAAYCLVRADDASDGMHRLVSTLEGYGLWKPEYAPLVNPVVGDLTQRLFGLDEELFDRLADEVDAICHSGALVDWMRPLEDYLGPNVVGAHEALRLASRGRGKAVHLISTFATLPKYLGLEVTEDDREYGYLTSKWMAEQLVAAARWRGARASVYRLPFVGASAGSGHFRLDRGDFLHNLLVGCIDLGSFPSLDASMSGVLPVDYLCQTIADVVLHDVDRVGTDFDFVNSAAPRFDDFFALLGAAGGGSAEVVPFDEWRSRALEHAAARPTGSLARIAAVLDGLTSESMVYMLSGLPAGLHVFGGEDHPAPPMDADFARIYRQRIDAERTDAERGLDEPLEAGSIA